MDSNQRDNAKCINDAINKVLISLIDNFSFDTNYLTVNALYEISQTMIHSYLKHDFKIDFSESITKKLEQMVEWTGTTKFIRYIQEAENSEEIPKITRKLLEILKFLSTIQTSQSREDEKSMPYSKLIDSLVSSDDPASTTETPDPNVVHTQELIVKAYVKVYLLSSQDFRKQPTNNRRWQMFNAQKPNPALFKQVRKIVHSYSTQAKVTPDDLEMAIKTYFIYDLSSISTNAGLLSEMIIQLYKDHLLNVDFESPSTDRVPKELLELLATPAIFSVNASNLEEGVKAVLQESFTKILAEAETLQQVCKTKQHKAYQRVRTAKGRIEKFCEHLYSFLNLCRMNRKNETASDSATSEFNEMLDAQFTKFISSPVFYMSGVTTIIDICSVWNQQNILAILKNHLPVHAQQIVKLMDIIKQQDPVKPVAEQSYLEKAIKGLFVSTEALNWKYKFKQSHDAGEVFLANAKLFSVAFFNLFKLHELVYKLCGESELLKFFDILKSNTTSLIQGEQTAFRYSLIADRNKDEKTEEAQFGNLLTLSKNEEEEEIYQESSDRRHPKNIPILRFRDESLTLVSASQVNEYFDQKRRLIFGMLSDLQAQKNSEENLIDRAGLMAQWKKRTSQENHSTVSMIQVTCKILVDFLDFISQSLPTAPDFSFKDLVSEHSRYMTNSSQTVNFISQLMTVIAGQLSLITRLISENARRTLPTDQLFKDTEVLMQHLDAISSRMLLLNALDQISSKSSSELYIVKGALYTCYETALNTLVQAKGPTTREDTGLENEKRMFKKIMYTFLLGQSIGHTPIALDKAYHGVFSQALTEAVQLLNAENLHKKQASTGAQTGPFVAFVVYSNEVLNKITQLHSVLNFVTSVRDHVYIDNENEHIFYLKAVEFTVSTLNGVIKQLEGTKVIQNESLLNKQSFLASYELLIILLISITEQKLASTYTQNLPADGFLTMFSTLYTALSHWKDLCTDQEDIQVSKSAVFKQQGLPHLLSVGLISDEILKHLVSDPQMILFLIKHLGVAFYTVAEAITLKGYDLPDLLAVKYKSLAYLDVKGVRLTTNSMLTFFEQFYPEAASKAWQTGFPSNGSELKSALSERSSTDGKITVAVQGGSSELISVLTYLKNACSESAKILLQIMAQDVVVTIEKYIESFFQDQPQEEIPRRLPKTQGPISKRLIVMFMLVRNYPELAVVLNSSIVTKTFQFPPGYERFAPQWNKEWTFLQFLIRYGCYFCYNEVKEFLQQLTAKSQTPVLVEYTNQMIPLSLYNELLIYKEILTVLKETLDEKKDFIKTTYSRIVWGVLPDLCATLLSEPQEKIHCGLRRQMIHKLYSLSARALEGCITGFVDEPDREDTSITDIIIEQFARLSELDIAIQMKLSLIQYADFLNQVKPSSNTLIRVSHAIKEQCYSFDQNELGFINTETSNLDLDQEIVQSQAVKVISYADSDGPAEALETICKHS